MKENINLIRNEINDSFAENCHIKHIKKEFLKYAIRKFTTSYSKTKANNSREKKLYLENKLKIFEQTFKMIKQINDIYKQELNTIYDEISEWIKIKSRFDWYEFREKSINFFKT